MATLLSDPRLAQCRCIFLRDWVVEANIGVYSNERGVMQRLLLNVDLYVRLSQSTPARDAIEEVVDYDLIRDVVRNRLAQGHVNLQETLVDDVASELLRHPAAVAVRVASEKTEIYENVAGIGVEILRFRDSP